MSRKNAVCSVGKRLLLFTLVSAIVLGASVAAYMEKPPQYLYSDGTWDSIRYVPPEAAAAKDPAKAQVLLDGHSHTTFSDGEMTPEQALRWHMAMGFNACVASDHDSLDGAVAVRAAARNNYNDTIKVILGVEWTSSRVHLNLIGVSTEFEQYFLANPPKVPFSPSDEEVRAIIEATHAHGGLVQVNHFNEAPGRPTFDQLLSWGIDIVEIINGASEEISFPAAEAFADAHSSQLGKIAGTDVHEPRRVHAWTALNVSAFTEGGIFAQLADRNASVLFDRIGTPDPPAAPENPAYTALLPLIYVGSALARIYEDGEAINAAGVVMLLVYLFGAFVIAELVRFTARKTQAWYQVKKKDLHK